MQHEYLARVSGWGNQAIYNSNYCENNSWLSPRIQSINCAIHHVVITGSSVALEKIMDLLYIIETEVSLSDKSKKKSKTFDNWLLQINNRFVFFAPFIPMFKKFKSRLRTAEVHEWSRLPDRLLTLQRPSYEENNESAGLINLLNNMWPALLNILNNERPNSICGIENATNWLIMMRDNDKLAIEAELEKLRKSY